MAGMRRLGLRQWFGMSRMSRWMLHVGLVALLLSSVLASTALMTPLTYAAPQPSQRHALSQRENQRAQDAWFQQSHFGNRPPTPGAQSAAIRQAAARMRSVASNSMQMQSQLAGVPYGGQWQSLGPAALRSTLGPPAPMSGEITSIAVDPNDLRWVVGTATGGLWSSSGGGWYPSPWIDQQASLAIGSVALRANPSKPPYNYIFAGTGDPNRVFGGFYPGEGIYETPDSGTTWTTVGFDHFAGLAISRIVIDPVNPQIMLLSAGWGGSWPTVAGGPTNPMNNLGIWRSTDSGQTWTQVLASEQNSAVPDAGTDVLFDPANPSIAYAGLGNVTANGATTLSGVYKSTDTGQTWTRISALPSGQDVERVTLAISNDGTHVYAVVTDGDVRDFPREPNFGGLLNAAIYVSADSGATWSAKGVSSTPDMATDSGTWDWWYFSTAQTEKTDPSGRTAYFGSAYIWKTTDGGNTWTNLSTTGGRPGPFEHAIAQNGYGGQETFLVGGEFGIWAGQPSGVDANLNYDPGSGQGALELTRFVSGSASNAGGDAVWGGSLTEGTDQYMGNLSADYPVSYWQQQDPLSVYGAGDVVTDYSNGSVVYDEAVGYSQVYIDKYDPTTSRWLDASSGIDARDHFNYDAPLIGSPSNHNELLVGTDRVYRTANGAANWSSISPVLGGAAGCAGGTYTCGTPLSALAIAPSNDSVIYVGNDNGYIYITQNGGASWTAGDSGVSLGGGQSIRSIATDPTNPAIVYASLGGYASGGQHLYKSTDYAAHWTDISTSLPNAPCMSVAVNPANANYVAVATDAGVFASSDGGATWAQFGTGVPNVAMSKIFFNPVGTQVFLATEGRGMWRLQVPHLTVTPAVITLTTPAGTNPPDQTIYIDEQVNLGAAWTISTPPSWISLSATSGTVFGRGQVAVTIHFNITSTTPQTYSTTLTLNAANADDTPISIPITVVTTNLSKHWYFAEGYTGSGFLTLIALANPNPTPAHVTLTYHLDQAPTVVTKTVTIGAYGRYTDSANATVRAAPGASATYPYGVATEVTSDVPVVAERPMYFDNQANGFDVMGATHLSPTFAFDDLDARAGHMTILTFLNPTSAIMYAHLTFYAAGTGAAYTAQYHIPANARGGIDVGNYVAAAGGAPGQYSGTVTLSSDAAGSTPAPGLVERPTYWTNPQTGFYNGEDVIGAPALQTTWNFAEGWTAGGGANQGQFHETLYLAYPAASGPDATVTVTIYREDGGAPVAMPLMLQAGHQTTVDIGAALPAGYARGNSIRVTSGQPILAERLMTWAYGATDVMGTQQTSNVAYFAESYTGPGFTEILTLENPNPTPAYLTITYLPAHDADPSQIPPPVTMTWTIPANARSGFGVNQFISGQGFAVQIVSSQPILTERIMYFDANKAGTDAAGYQGEP